MIIKILHSRKKRTYHQIFGKATEGTFAEYLLLKRHFQKQDPEYKVLSNYKRIWLNFRNRLIRQIKKKNKGRLTCHYCQSKNLVMNINVQGVPRNRRATLDHVIPRSKGGREFAESNLVVACFSCNQKKKDNLPVISSK